GSPLLEPSKVTRAPAFTVWSGPTFATGGTVWSVSTADHEDGSGADQHGGARRTNGEPRPTHGYLPLRETHRKRGPTRHIRDPNPPHYCCSRYPTRCRTTTFPWPATFTEIFRTRPGAPAASGVKPRTYCARRSAAISSRTWGRAASLGSLKRRPPVT